MIKAGDKHTETVYPYTEAYGRLSVEKTLKIDGVECAVSITVKALEDHQFVSAKGLQNWLKGAAMSIRVAEEKE